MKKLLIVSMLGLGLLTQATEQEQQDQAVLAASAEQAVAMQDTNQTDETSARASVGAEQNGDEKKSRKMSYNQIKKQYLAGFVFGSITGAGCRLGEEKETTPFMWMTEWMLRNKTLDLVQSDMKNYQETELAAGVRIVAELGSWAGYLAVHALLLKSTANTTTSTKPR